jgi:hypothetical protein
VHFAGSAGFSLGRAAAAHVAQRHRRVLGVHFVNDVEPLASPVMASVIVANLCFASAKRV